MILILLERNHPIVKSFQQSFSFCSVENEYFPRQRQDSRYNDIKPNDTQHNDIKHNDTQHNVLICNSIKCCYAEC